MTSKNATTATIADSKTSVLSWVDKYQPKSWGDDSDDEEDPILPPVATPVVTPVATPVATPVVKQCPWAPIKAPVVSFKDIQKEPIRIGFKEKEIKEIKEIKPPKNGICTLMVKNLPRDTTPKILTEEIRRIFSSFGSLKDVYIPTNRDGPYAGTIKGFAKVQFLSSDHAYNASLSSHYLRRPLFVEFANQDR